METNRELLAKEKETKTVEELKTLAEANDTEMTDEKCIAKRTHTPFGKCSVCGKLSNCNNCYWCSYEKGLWLCNNPEKKR